MYKLKNSHLATLIVLLCVCFCTVFAGTDPNQKPFVFVQLTDPQLGFGGYAHDVNTFEQAISQINVIKPDFVVICGDLINDFNDKSVSDFKAIKSRLTVPCYAAPGNHDVTNKPTSQTLTRYRNSFGDDYFSFKHKGYTFVITDTSLWKAPFEGETQKMDAWFKNTLQAAHDANSPVFIVQHFPIYTKSPDEPNNYYDMPTAKRKEIFNLIENNGVVAILSGHVHNTIINNYKSIQMVCCEVTSKNSDKQPLGFRLWQVSPKSIKNEFVPLK